MRLSTIGFGWIQAKPAIASAPVAVTLGAACRDGQVDRALLVNRNSQRFGAAEDFAMAYNFPRLIEHAARTHALSAGI